MHAIATALLVLTLSVSSFHMEGRGSRAFIRYTVCNGGQHIVFLDCIPNRLYEYKVGNDPWMIACNRCVNIQYTVVTDTCVVIQFKRTPIGPLELN